MLPAATVELEIVERGREPGVKGTAVGLVVHVVCKISQLAYMSMLWVQQQLTELEPEQIDHSTLPLPSLCVSSHLQSRHPAR